MLYSNGNVFLSGKFVRADIYTENGIITHIKNYGDGMRGHGTHGSFTDKCATDGSLARHNPSCQNTSLQNPAETTAPSILDCTDCYIIPGLVDIHTHGCIGYDFSTADMQMIEKMAEYYYKSGISAVLATTMTNDRDVLFRSAKACAEYIESNANNNTESDCNKNIEFDCNKSTGFDCNKSTGFDCGRSIGFDCGKSNEFNEFDNQIKEKEQLSRPWRQTAHIAGIYMEGPFFLPAKKGAHDAKYLLPIDEDYLNAYDTACGGNIKVVAFDPLLDGSDGFIQKYKDKYVLTIAHTACGYDRAMSMMSAGVKHVTHLFNAMDGLDKRAPGVPGAVLDTPDCYAELICDGVHIHPAVIRSTFAQHADHTVIISDSMSATGLPDGEYTLGGQKVYVKDGEARLNDGTIAGSVMNLFEMMKNVISYGVNIEQAVASVTINPAKSVHIDDSFGVIAEGRRDDFIVMDKNLNILNR